MIWGWLTLLQPETGLDAHASLCTAIWTPWYPVYTLLSMRGSRIFARVGPGQSDKKALTTFFFVLSLFYWIQMVNFEENYHFSRFQRGSNIFHGGGGPTFSGGSDCLYPIGTHITCDFPGGSDPLTRHWIRTCYLDQQEIAFFPFSRRWVVFFSFI